MKNIFILFLMAIGLSCSPKIAPDASWARERWVVTEMKGVPVQQSGGRKDAFLNFNVSEKRFTGNGGCNQINGNYTVDKREIHFSEVISTKMSCEDIAFENTFLDLLSKVDRFEHQDDRILLKRKREILLVLNARSR
jgi:heat shock protein HslJ